MKKNILQLALIISLGGLSYAQGSPVELFEKDYSAIQKEIMRPYIGAFSADNVTYKALSSSDEQVDYSVKSLLNLSHRAEDIVELSEEGAALFTNYSEKGGMATLRSKVSLLVTVLGDNDRRFSFKLEEGDMQGQIDRAAKRYERSVEFGNQRKPLTSFGLEDGELKIKGIHNQTQYNFDEDFNSLLSWNNHFDGRDLELVFDNNNRRRGKLNAQKGTLVQKYEAENNYAQTLFELQDLSLTKLMAPETLREFFSPRFKAMNKVEKNHDQLEYRGEFKLDEVVLKQKGLKSDIRFGNFEFNYNLAPISEDYFSNLEKSAEKVSELRYQETLDNEQAFAILSDMLSNYIIDGTTLNAQFKAHYQESEFRGDLAVVPNKDLVEMIHSGEKLEDLLEADEFPDFVTQYVDSLYLKADLPKSYFAEVASSFLMAEGEFKDRDSARKGAELLFEQGMMLLSLMDQGDVDAFKITDEGIAVEIQYKDQLWNVNGKTLSSDEIRQYF